MATGMQLTHTASEVATALHASSMFIVIRLYVSSFIIPTRRKSLRMALSVSAYGYMVGFEDGCNGDTGVANA